MKRVNCFMMLAAAFAFTAGVTSCNKNEMIETGEIKPGEPTSLELSIYMPRASQTYSANTDDLNATDGEIGMDKVNVLIYAETSGGSFILEQNAERTNSQFDKDLATPDRYILKATNKITTTTGKKKLYVIMNYPGLASTLPAVGSPLADLSDFIYTLTAANDLSSADDHFTMSSVQEEEKTLVAETTPGTTPAGNKATVTVKRLVAKVTVQEDLTRDVNGDIISHGGILSNLQFAVGNTNKKIYVFQKKVGTAPNIVVQDPNWGSYLVADFFNSILPASYKAVDATATAVRSLNAAYAPENTAETYATNGENLTYISVRAQYQPAFFCDEDGESLGANAASPKSFWTVTKSDGSILYFDDKDNADTYASTISATPSEYTDGYCYFRAYINKRGVADANIAGSKAAKFDVLRNNYYQATITGIKAPGSHEDKGNPEEETSLLMDIIVQPWAVVTDDYDLH